MFQKFPFEEFEQTFYMTVLLWKKTVKLFDKIVNKRDFLKMINLYLSILTDLDATYTLKGQLISE